MSEMEAAARFGLAPDVYFSKSRIERAAMTGFVIVDSALQNMKAYDLQEETKKKG